MKNTYFSPWLINRAALPHGSIPLCIFLLLWRFLFPVFGRGVWSTPHYRPIQNNFPGFERRRAVRWRSERRKLWADSGALLSTLQCEMSIAWTPMRMGRVGPSWPDTREGTRTTPRRPSHRRRIPGRSWAHSASQGLTTFSAGRQSGRGRATRRVMAAAWRGILTLSVDATSDLLQDPAISV